VAYFTATYWGLGNTECQLLSRVSTLEPGMAERVLAIDTLVLRRFVSFHSFTYGTLAVNYVLAAPYIRFLCR
jgi:hypothetical protein